MASLFSIKAKKTLILLVIVLWQCSGAADIFAGEQSGPPLEAAANIMSNMIAAEPKDALKEDEELFDEYKKSLSILGNSNWKRHNLTLLNSVQRSRARGVRKDQPVNMQPSYDFSLNMVPNDPYYPSQWGLRSVNAEDAWDISTGSGITVAVLDTGVDINHSDLASQIWHNPGEIPSDGIDNDGNGYIDDYTGYNFTGSNGNITDVYGHGTHVSGIIAAEGNDSNGIIGLAPGAKIMPVKVLSDSGWGYWSWVAQGIRYAADMGAHIVNMSLGGFGYASVVYNAVQYAVSKGVTVIAAAGNSNVDIAGYSPSGLDGVISVAATTSSNNRASFSNWGATLDIAAPGVSILSTFPGERYRSWGGTSMAAPFAAALAALLLSEDITLTPQDITDIMRSTAQDLGAPGFDIFFGYGLIDAYMALLEVQKAAYTYYESGRIHTKTLEKDGAIFEYIDEDWNGRGYGRLIKHTRPDGTYRVLSDFFPDTDQARYESEYDPNGDLLYINGYDVAGKLISRQMSDGVFITFYSSGRMHTKLMPNGVLYEYKDEDWNSNGYGRLIKETAPDGSYKTFEGYYANTDQAMAVKRYDAGGTLLSISGYDINGNFIGYGDDSAIYTSFYEASGRVLAKQFYQATSIYSKGTILEYSDEALYDVTYNADMNNQRGNIIKQINPDGTYKTFEQYYAGTPIPRYVNEYDLDGSLIIIHEHDQLGNDIGAHTYYASGNVRTSTRYDGTIYHYRDENWNNTGFGRVTAIYAPDGTYQTFTYHDQIDQVSQYTKYNADGEMVLEILYNRSGHMLSKTEVVDSLKTYYKYYVPSGRLYRKYFNVPNTYSGHWIYYYRDVC
ncbi:S8 family serine peptidase [Candidatus Omnitrophota bacterium]